MSRWKRLGWFVLLALALAGCSYTPPPDGYLTPLVPSYDFGKVLIGETATTPALPDWRNTGRGAVRLDGFTVTGDTRAIVQWPMALPLNMNPGNVTASIFFDFTPTEARRYSVRVQPYGVGPNNRPISAGSAELTGTGVFQIDEGDLSVGGGYVQPGRGLDFGNVVVGTNAYRTLTIANSGNAAITPTVRWFPGIGPFTASMSSGGAAIANVNVPAGGSATVIITFTPPLTQKYVSALILQAGANGRAGISVSGTGVKPID